MIFFFTIFLTTKEKYSNKFILSLNIFFYLGGERVEYLKYVDVFM